MATKGLKKNRIRFFYSIFFAGMYAFWLTSLPGALFKDRANYLIYAQYAGDKLSAIGSQFEVFREPLFLVFNKLLLLAFNDAVLSVNILVFIISFSVCFFCFYRLKSFIFGLVLLIFLFVQTQSLGMQLVTLRQGIGMAILVLLAPVLKNKLHILILLGICGFIHNSFFIVAMFYGIYWLMDQRLSWSYYFKLFIFILIGLVFSTVFFVLLSYVSAKQEYSNFDYSSGGGAFALWSLVLIYILIFKRKQSRNASIDQFLFDISVVGLVIYVTGYFLTPISGRIIGSFIPFIGLLLIKRAKTLDLIFFSVLFLINCYLYFNGAFEGFLDVPLEVFHRYLFSVSVLL